MSTPVKVIKLTKVNTQHFWPPQRLALFISRILSSPKFFIKPTETYKLIAFLHNGWINFRLHGSVEYCDDSILDKEVEFMDVDWIKEIYEKSLQTGFIDECEIERKIIEEYDKENRNRESR